MTNNGHHLANGRAHRTSLTETLPPHSREAERSLLSSMLRNNTIIPEVLAIVQPGHFYVFAHQLIFVAIAKLHADDEGIDIVIVAERLISAGTIVDAGGVPYLAELWDAAPSAANYPAYAKTIIEKAGLRHLRHLANDLHARLHDPTATFAELKTEFEGRVAELDQGGSSSQRYRFAPIDSAAFACADYRLKWLIQRLLVRGQPCIVGGPKKALKTSLLIALALALGTGLPFLGTFMVYEPVRVVVISGESGEHTIQETARRIALAMNIDLASADVHWDFRLPQLSVASELASLGRGLRNLGAVVVIIDPLYLALLSGQGEQGLQASNLYDMGPLLMRVAQTCLAAGATPILAHHAKKTRLNGFDPLDLDDLAFSGIAEFARQWLLVSRREAYEPGTGIHRLWLSSGGSTGHGGLWATDIDEGIIDVNFAGRRWDVCVLTPGESKQGKADANEDKRSEKQRKKESEEEIKLLNLLDSLDPQKTGCGVTRLRQLRGVNNEKINCIVARLVYQTIVEEIDDFRVSGKAAKGIRRTRSGQSGQ